MAEDKKKEIDVTVIEVTEEYLKEKLYKIRGKRVLLDADLAEIYGYDTKGFNRQVKNNIEKFDEDFMFELTDEELEDLRYKNCTANLSSKSRYNPHVFTEQQQSIFIMRAFKEMRHYIRQNRQFVTQSEMNLVTAKVSELSVQMAGVVDRQKQTEKSMEEIRKSIDVMNENFITEKDFKNFVIYKGQKFEADAAYIDIYQQAAKSIYVVDDYMNTKTLQLLSQKQSGVEVILFTENGHGKKGFLTSAVVNDFINQYPTLRIKPNPDCHDRWIVLDYELPTEAVYHCGASSKDAGKKLCAINKVDSVQMIHPVIDRLLLLPDKQI